MDIRKPVKLKMRLPGAMPITLCLTPETARTTQTAESPPRFDSIGL